MGNFFFENSKFCPKSSFKYRYILQEIKKKEKKKEIVEIIDQKFPLNDLALLFYICLRSIFYTTCQSSEVDKSYLLEGFEM